MNKTLKKLLSVVLTMAMIVTSITVYNTTAKAEGGVIEFTVVKPGNGRIERVEWTNPVNTASNKVYLYTKEQAETLTAESTFNDGNSAKSSNANWIWNDNAEIRTFVDLVVTDKADDIKTENGGEFVIVVVDYDAEGNVIAFGKANINVPAYANTKLNAKDDRTDNFNAVEQAVSWTVITNAKRYEVKYKDEVLASTDNGKATYLIFKAPIESGSYSVDVIAYAEDGSVIVKETVKMHSITKLEGRPDENDISKVDTTSWVKLESKSGTVDGKMDGTTANADAGTVNGNYEVNAKHGLATFWFGIYAPHSIASYHFERGCKLPADASAFIFQIRNVAAVWVDGVKYENGTEYMNNQNDCCELNLSLFTNGTHVVTLVNSNNQELKTFAIKAELSEEEQCTVNIDGTEKSVTKGSKITLGENPQGYYDATTGTAYQAGEEIVVDGDITLTSIKLEVSMTDGASVRLASPTGMRFQTNVSSTGIDANVILNQDNNTVKTGTLITKYDLYEKQSSLKLDSDYTKLNVENSGWYNSKVGTFCGSIVNIHKENYGEKYIAVGYATITYDNGKTMTIYADVNEGKNARAISYVAQKAIESGKYENYKEFLKQFVE